MSELFVSQVRQLDNTTNTLWWAENLGDGAPNRLLGRPVVFNSAIDGVANGGADNLMAVLGNFVDAYVIARRIGFTVELIPHLFSDTTTLPSLQRGLIGYARAVLTASMTRRFRCTTSPNGDGLAEGGAEARNHLSRC